MSSGVGAIASRNTVTGVDVRNRPPERFPFAAPAIGQHGRAPASAATVAVPSSSAPRRDDNLASVAARTADHPPMLGASCLAAITTETSVAHMVGVPVEASPGDGVGEEVTFMAGSVLAACARRRRREGQPPGGAAPGLCRDALVRLAGGPACGTALPDFTLDCAVLRRVQIGSKPHPRVAETAHRPRVRDARVDHAHRIDETARPQRMDGIGPAGSGEIHRDLEVSILEPLSRRAAAPPPIPVRPSSRRAPTAGPAPSRPCQRWRSSARILRDIEGGNRPGQPAGAFTRARPRTSHRTPQVVGRQLIPSAATMPGCAERVEGLDLAAESPP